MSSSPAIDIRTLYNFIHQVVNPMNGVIGTIDNMIDGSLKGDRDQRLRAVRAQLEHSVELIRNMAYLSQLGISSELEKLRATPQRCCIPEIVIQAAQFFQESDSGVKIELEDRETQYCVQGHRDLLRQVFMNLFDNAVKYSDAGSRIEIRSRVQKKTNDLIVEVRNMGVGFHNSDRDRIFELGFRSAEAESHTSAGSGLGLYICKRILADVYGAKIEAEHNVEARITTMRIRFKSFKNEGKRNFGGRA